MVLDCHVQRAMYLYNVCICIMNWYTCIYGFYCTYQNYGNLYDKSMLYIILRTNFNIHILNPGGMICDT